MTINKTPTFLLLFAFAVVGLFIHPMTMMGDVLYTQTNSANGNSVVAFEQNPQTGTLALKGIYPTGGTGNPNFIGFSQDTVVKEGPFLFAVNAGSNDISVFEIQPDGGLKLAAPPVASGGIAPITLAVSHNLLYVANQGDGTSVPANYAGFFVRAGGGLQAIPNSTVTLSVGAFPTDLRFAPGRNLLVANRRGDNTIETFAVSEDGRLAHLAALTGPAGHSGPFGMEFNPVVPENLIVGLFQLPGIASYRVGDNGSVTQLGSVTDLAAVDSCWVAMLHDGKTAFFSGFFGQSVVRFRVNPDQTITAVSSHDSSAFGKFASDLQLDGEQRYLYELLPGSGAIHVMRVSGTGADGGLSDVQTVSLPSGASPMGLLFAGAFNESLKGER